SLVNGDIGWSKLRFDLHTEPGLIEAESASTSEYVNTAICARRRNFRNPSVRFKHRIHQFGQAMTGISCLDVGHDLVVGGLCKITFLLITLVGDLGLLVDMV